MAPSVLHITSMVVNAWTLLQSNQYLVSLWPLWTGTLQWAFGICCSAIVQKPQQCDGIIFAEAFWRGKVQSCVSSNTHHAEHCRTSRYEHGPCESSVSAPRVWCISNSTSPVGNSMGGSERSGSSTQDDKILLDVDPEVLPAMAASCNIFTVVVPCSFNGLS